MDRHARFCSETRLRYGRAGPRKCDDQAGDGEIPGRHADAPQPHPRNDRPEEIKRRHRSDVAERVPLGAVAPGSWSRWFFGRIEIKEDKCQISISGLTAAR